MRELISVIIPCYNVEKYLRRCLESLVSQTYGLDNLELILIYDQSEDRTLSVMKEFESRYPERTLIIDCKKKIGVSAARNIGLEYAKGRYISYVDADDICSKYMLERLQTVSEKYDCDYSECGFHMFRDISELEFDEEQGEETVYDLSQVLDRKKLILNALNNAVWGRLYKREFLMEQKIEFPIDLYYEDVYHTALGFMVAKKCCQIPDRLYGYFHNENGIMFSRYDSQKMKMEVKIIELLIEELKQRGLWREIQVNYKNEFEFYCVWKCFCDPVRTIMVTDIPKETAAKDILFFKSFVNNMFQDAARNPYFEQCSDDVKEIVRLLKV